MNIANWNRALLTVVLILLLLVGLVLIKVLFHGSSKLEWGSLSDMVSAACNVAMAGAAVYAAFNAKNWLSSKLNDRKFKFADELIDKFCILEQESLHLLSDIKQTINTDPDTQGDDTKFNKKWSTMYDRKNEYRKKIVSLRTDMERMKLWGLEPINERDFEILIMAHLKLSSDFENSLAIGSEDKNSRCTNSFKYDRTITKQYAVVRGSHNKIMKHYSNLFRD